MMSERLRKRFFFVVLVMVMASVKGYAQEKEEAFTNWDHLKNEIPQWLKDAKFGIYFHWGVYNVPAYNSEWYSRTMYVPGTSPNKHHLATYGPLKTFGYKDFIPMFTAGHFNADEWVDLFVRAGAKFAGPVAEHADGFSMWDSKVNAYNAKDMGPKVDIVKAMQKAVRKRNLKFITTFHHQWQWGWYPTFDSSTDAGDPKYAGLYGPVVSKDAWLQKDSAERPSDEFNKQWLTKVEEVVNKYKPDLLYFDSRLGHIGESYRKQVATTFYNSAKNRKDRIILYKAKDLPQGVGMSTYEKTRLNKMGENTWLTEEPISTYSWSYTSDIKLRNAEDIVKGLVDIVSKNGVYLLNICPKADGTIPQDQKEILLAIGGWMHQYGDAIYDTHPWYTYGEGPAKEADEKAERPTTDRRKYFEIKFTADDVRYTRKGNTVNAIILGKPAEGQKILLKAFNKNKVPEKISITEVTMAGSSEKITWEYLDEGLSVTIPAAVESEVATVLKIQTVAK
jgi:alpha-L-fucosidase